jgi:hypothetical protein
MAKSRIRTITSGFDASFDKPVGTKSSDIGDDYQSTGGSPEPIGAAEGNTGAAPDREHVVSIADVEQHAEFTAQLPDSGGTDGSFDSGSDSPRRRRGRPPGSVAKEKVNVQDSLKDIETLLYSSHLLLAGLAGKQRLALAEEQAKKLSDAIKGVAAYYPIGLSPKNMAIANLIMVGGAIYVPMCMDIIGEMGKPKQPPQGGQARPMPPVQPTQQGPQAVPRPGGPRKISEMAPSDLYGTTWTGG